MGMLEREAAQRCFSNKQPSTPRERLPMELCKQTVLILKSMKRKKVKVARLLQAKMVVTLPVKTKSENGGKKGH